MDVSIGGETGVVFVCRLAEGMAQSEFRKPKAEDCLSDCHTCSQMANECVNPNPFPLTYASIQSYNLKI
jgi:hypothetical protein